MWRDSDQAQSNRSRAEPGRTSASLLIQVPAVRERPSQRWRPAIESTPRPRLRRRRRLRREIKMVGAALGLGVLIATPVLLACGIGAGTWQGRAEGSTTATWDEVSTDTYGLAPILGRDNGATEPIAIELEPPVATPDSSPIAFPGYLLPGDEREEARNAGS